MVTPVSLGSANQNTSNTTMSMTGGVAIQAGDLVVVTVGYDANGTATGVSDGTNTYVLAQRVYGANWGLEVWYCGNAHAVSNPTITATLTGSVGFSSIGAARTPSSGNGWFLDQVSGAQFTGTTGTVSTGTMAQAGDIVFGASYVFNNTSVTPSSGFTQIIDDDYPTHAVLDLEYQNASGTGSVSYSPSWSTSVGGGFESQIVVSFTNAPAAISLGSNILFTSSTPSSITQTTTANIQSGDTVVVAVLIDCNTSGAAVSSISDGANTYSRVARQQNTSPGNGYYLELWAAYNCSAVSSGSTITANLTSTGGNNSYYGLNVARIPGLGSAPLDSGSVTSSANAVSIATGTLAANEVVIAAMTNEATVTDSSPFAPLSEAHNDAFYFHLAYTTASGGNTVTYGPATRNDFPILAIAGFKVAIYTGQNSRRRVYLRR